MDSPDQPSNHAAAPCAQCGSPASRCARCHGAVCDKRLCVELHDAACAGLKLLPAAPPPHRLVQQRAKKVNRAAAPLSSAEGSRNLADELVQGILKHRRDGRDALLVGTLDEAFLELWAARELEADLERLGTAGALAIPADMERETDLVPLARALSSRSHPRFAQVWRRVLEDRPARSIQAEAAEWLARDAFGRGASRHALRILHAGSHLGRPVEAEAFRDAYKKACLDVNVVFSAYLVAVRLDPHAARAADLRDPLTDGGWADQDPAWWRAADTIEEGDLPARAPTGSHDHQREALVRARHLATSHRDQGWLLLAEGDFLCGLAGPRALGRTIRGGLGDQSDSDLYMRVRMAYEGAADRLPDAAWPFYRLAELLAWAGFSDRAREHLQHADGRSLGDRTAEQAHRATLKAMVEIGLGERAEASVMGPRPYPTQLFGQNPLWRLRNRPGARKKD